MRDNDRGKIGADDLVQERREFFLGKHKSDQQKTYDNETGEHTSGQGPIFIYKTGRRIWRTKNKEPINRSGKSERVHRLVKGEQRDKDNKRVVEEDHRINES